MEFDISTAHGAEKYTNALGSTTYLPAFVSDEEKERASKIVDYLHGMTIREAQDFLIKLSEALTGAGKL